MSWADSVVSWAQDAGQRAKHFVDGILPDFSKLPIVSNPVVLMVKGSDALMKGVVAQSNDFAIKREGVEPFNKLPDSCYDAIDEGQAQTHSVTNLVADYAQAGAAKVSDAVAAAVDAVMPAPGSPPLWLKLTIAAAVVVGSAVVLSSLVSGRRYA